MLALVEGGPERPRQGPRQGRTSVVAARMVLGGILLPVFLSVWLAGAVPVAGGEPDGRAGTGDGQAGAPARGGGDRGLDSRIDGELQSAASLPPLAIQPGERERPRIRRSSDCIACRLDPQPILTAYSSEDWERLQSGEVLIRSLRGPSATSEGSGRTSAAGVIDRTPEHVWSVLTDFENWPAFVPLVTNTEVTRRDGARTWVRQTFRVVFSRMSHTTVYEMAPRDGRLSWWLDRSKPHDIAASRGTWQFVPVSAGESTLVRYRAQMDAGRAIPEFIEDMLLRRSLRELIVQLREESMRTDR